MQVIFLDNNVRKFLKYTALFLFYIIAFILILAYINSNFTLAAYNTFLSILMICFFILILFTLVSVISIIGLSRKRKTSRFQMPFIKYGLRILMPVTLFFATLMGNDKDSVRSFYIEMNNLISESSDETFRPEDILVLLPHCLQNSDCGHKITNDINNCKQCGKCVISDLLDIVRERNVRAVVVTGGTAARNIVLKEKPKAVLSVACERDLASGIMDVNKLPKEEKMPVIGVLNTRPNGPCFNTNVDVDTLAEKLDHLLGRNKVNGG